MNHAVALFAFPTQSGHVGVGCTNSSGDLGIFDKRYAEFPSEVEQRTSYIGVYPMDAACGSRALFRRLSQRPTSPPAKPTYFSQPGLSERCTLHYPDGSSETASPTSCLGLVRNLTRSPADLIRAEGRLRRGEPDPLAVLTLNVMRRRDFQRQPKLGVPPNSFDVWMRDAQQSPDRPRFDHFRPPPNDPGYVAHALHMAERKASLELAEATVLIRTLVANTNPDSPWFKKTSDHAARARMMDAAVALAKRHWGVPASPADTPLFLDLTYDSPFAQAWAAAGGACDGESLAELVEHLWDRAPLPGESIALDPEAEVLRVCSRSQDSLDWLERAFER